MRRTKAEAEKTRRAIIASARRVFYERGVSRSPLERIAKEAGVTRGAIYWHFKDKAALFFAMRDVATLPLIAKTDSILFDAKYDNPLDALETAINVFMDAIKNDPVVREVFEIMVTRCEYVDEFADAIDESSRPAITFLDKIRRIYQRAVDKKCLGSHVDAAAAAADTWSFTSGLLHLIVNHRADEKVSVNIAEMVRAHIALRRAI